MGKSANDIIYLWRIKNTNHVKIGVTSSYLGKKRIQDIASKMSVKYEILGMYNIINARETEQKLHEEYTINPNLPVCNGHTEFRILNTKEIEEIKRRLEILAENR